MQETWRIAARDREELPCGMIYRFGAFELDLATMELCCDGKRRDVEPQVFALLALLVENRDRVLSKDEIVEKVWDGRAVSDGAIASRVKSARQALGDDGQSQRLIRTIHRRGFRFVAEAQVLGRPLLGAAATGASQQAGPPGADPEQASRPSLALLPLRVIGSDPRCEGFATALPAELIADLSRLRWLFVTARGSSFRIHGDVPLDQVGRLLGVRYCLCGTAELAGPRLVLTLELVDTHDGGVVWADRFAGRIDDVHAMREEIRERVVTALDIRIPMHEGAKARLSVPDDLDAWSAYHLGLQHIYRFNRADNARAAGLFERAVSLDPCFARGHAGLSFVHFQTAFMRYAEDTSRHVGEARRCAERALELDPLDPFANFTMGRSYWLEGDLEASLGWLERGTAICPNYAQGLYARAWTEALAGSASESRAHVDLAMRLSPIDPLYYAMMATRSFSHMVLAQDEEAADWADRAARSPGAHVLIAMIAAAAQALNRNTARADHWSANVRKRNGSLGREDFFRAFPMKTDALRARVSRALSGLGF